MPIMDAIKGAMGSMGSAISGMFGGQQPPAQSQGPADQPRQQIAEQIPPLSDKELSLWKSRLQRARTHHRKYFDAAEVIKREYLGPCDAVLSEQARVITNNDSSQGKPVNLVASFINSILPQVMPQNPWITGSAKKPGDIYAQGAKILEARQRQVFDDPANYKHMRLAAHDAFYLAGYLLVGWKPNSSQAAFENSQMDSDTEDNKTLPPSQEATASEAMMSVPYDDVFLRHIAYYDVFADPDVSMWEDKKWVCYVSEKRIIDIQAQEGKIYHNTQDVRSTNVRDEDDYYRQDRPEQPQGDDKLAKIYTILHHGRKRGEFGVLVLAGNNKTEIRHDYVYFGCLDYPIQRLTYQDVDRLMPASIVQFWLDLHSAFNEFLSEATERAAQSKRIVVVKDKPTQDSIVNAAGGSVIIGQAESIKELAMGGTMPDTYKMMELFQGLAEKVSAIDDAQRGVGGGGSQTATQSQIVNQFAQTKIGDLQGHENRFLRQVAICSAGLLIAHQWQDVDVQVDQDSLQAHWAIFNNQVLPPDVMAYDFEFDVANRTRLSPVVKQKRAQDRLALLGDPNIQAAAQQEGYSLSIIEGFKDLLDASDEVDVQRYLKKLPPQPDPQQMIAQQSQQAQGENQQMEQGNAVPVNGGQDNHSAHVQIHLQGKLTPLLADHMAEHYAYLQMIQQQAGGQQAPPKSGARKNNKVIRISKGTRVGGDAQIAGQAGNVG